MREVDWSATDLGPAEEWPETLRVAVSLGLTSRFPILLWWGPKRNVLYNDAYIPFLGETKHPRVLAQPGYNCWKEIWPTIGPLLDSVYATGNATFAEEQLFFFARKLPKEEVYVRFTYGPILTEDGKSVGGVFCPCTEITEVIVGSRRLETMRKLGGQATLKASVNEGCEEIAKVLGSNPHDIPFAAIYLVDRDGARATLTAVAGFGADSHPLPTAVSIPSDRRDPWGVSTVLRTHTRTEIADLAKTNPEMRAGPWRDAIQRAILLPIFRPTEEQLSVIVLLGISTRRPFDESYSAFLDLVAGHVGSTIANAEAHEAERQRAEALAELDRAKTAFFSNISHEFRTPLALMLGPLEQMLGPQSSSLTVDRSDVEFIRRNGERLLRLVNTLLDFSRIEAGRMNAWFQPTDLADFTIDLASVFRSAIEHAGLRLRVNCPPLGEPVYVDRSFWERIVLNLISNALKFTFDGSIAVSLRQCGSNVKLVVADTGIGISAKELPHLFERFHRIEGARCRTHEGTGIGLATVYELTKLNGGSVHAKSSDRGSRFTVSIPLGREHLPADQVSDDTQEAAPTSRAKAFTDEAVGWLEQSTRNIAGPNEIAGTLPRILVADDNADMRHYLERLLKKCYHVTSVSDGEAALQEARNNPPDLIIADIMMPKWDGLALLEQLRAVEKTRNIPVIMLSARAGEESRIEGLKAGANDYLAKPFNERELLASVSAHLDLARLANDAVRSEQDRRVLAEAAERRTLNELAAELGAMTRLHELCTRLVTTNELQPLLEEVLNATIGLQNSDFGTVQLYRPELGILELVAHRGFDADGIGSFKIVDKHGASSCGRALKLRRSVIVEDVNNDPESADLREAAAELGFRAQHSTPLFSRNGELLGMMTTHFRKPHRPSERDLRFTDLYAREAAEAIERKQAEEALRTSEERFRRYFELGLIGMALTSTTKGILEVNDELCRILGYSREELLRKTWAEMTHPDDVAADVRQFERVLAGEIDGYILEKRWLRKGGGVLHSVMAAKCQRRPDDSVDYFVGLVLDITERKHAEEELRRSEAYRAQSERLSHTGTWALNVATGELFWSEEHFRILGLDPQMVTPRYPGAIRVIHAEDRGSVIEALERAISEKTEFDTECRVVRPDGTIRFIRSLAQPVRNKAGQVIEYVGTIIDMTEQLHAEEELRRSESHLADAQRIGHVGSWIWNVSTGECLWSKEHYRMVGLDPDTFKPTRDNTQTLIHPEDLPVVEQTLTRAIREKSDYEMEYRIIRPDGLRYHRCIGRPVAKRNGNLQFTGVVVDLTQSKQAEQALQDAQTELAHVGHVNAMAEMAAAIAHEINQPLGAIVNNSRWCLQFAGKPDAEARKRAALEDIASDAHRASEIIGRIRSLTSDATREITQLNVDDLITDVITFSQHLLTEHRVELKRCVPRNVPLVSGERVQLQQVLLNLVTNAIESMSRANGKVRRLTIRAARAQLDNSPAIVISVEDTGAGFDANAAKRMFDAFYTTKSSGMGMGLRISRSIVESYGGWLSARRNRNGGATFSFSLPLRNGED